VIPGDETCHHLVEVDSVERVAEAFEQVGLQADRIVEAVGLHRGRSRSTTKGGSHDQYQGNLRLFVAVVAAVGVVAFGAAQASASSAPIVIPYAKTCDQTGHCVGTAGAGGTIEMQVTGLRATGHAAQLTLTEWITVGDISFTAEMNGRLSPGGFIVLNGTVTNGSFAGAEVHQRSNLVGGNATTTAWTGQLQLLPASA
jgi:hypothetical protein